MKPTIVLENDVFLKVMHWVNKSNDEVSGLGTLRIEPNGVLRVVSAMLLPQKNGATHTDIEAEDVNKALFELRNEPGELRWWWHSHVNMGVFWSGTDMDTIKKIGAGGWFAASVFNKKREIKSACWVQHGQVVALPWQDGKEPQPMFLDDCETKVVEYKHPQADAWDAEYEKNVTAMRSFPTTPTVSSVAQPWASRGYLIDRRTHGSAGGQMGRTGISTETPTITTPGTTGTDLSQISHIEPPAQRPAGMSKRDYKRWKRLYRERQNLLATIRRPEIVSSDDTDMWGFTKAERIMLAQEGWEDDEIEEALEEFSPNDLLLLAKGGIGFSEISFMLSQQYAPTDIVSMAKDWMTYDEQKREATHAVSE